MNDKYAHTQKSPLTLKVFVMGASTSQRGYELESQVKDATWNNMREACGDVMTRVGTVPYSILWLRQSGKGAIVLGLYLMLQPTMLGAQSPWMSLPRRCQLMSLGGILFRSFEMCSLHVSTVHWINGYGGPWLFAIRVGVPKKKQTLTKETRWLQCCHQLKSWCRHFIFELA